MLHHIKTHAARIRRRHDGKRRRRNVRKAPGPELCVLQDAVAIAAQVRRQRPAELPAAALIGRDQRRDFVVAETIGMELFEIIARIVDQEF